MTVTLLKPSPTRSLRSPTHCESLFLLSVTAFAAILRFSFLARPCLWGDEALTFSRICGTFNQMLDVLREDAFGPLHYELYWFLARRFQMTPFMMRLWPAITGTLMVPAIYMLGFELLGRRIARISAVLAASSAFLLAFSRDAKMYMPLWFFITLHIACLLWWMRTGRSTAWLAFVAAGCLATGLHFTGLILLPLDLLIGLTGSNLTWKRSLLLALGTLLILSGPIGFTWKFNQVRQRVDQQGWRATEIGWVAGRTDGHDGAALAADEAGALAFCFSWLDEQGVRVQVPQAIMASAAAFLALFASAIAAGAVSWRRNPTTDDFTPNTPGSEACPEPVERVLRRPGSVAQEPRSSDSPPTPLQSWRAALWLSVWILVPAYGFYRATVPVSSMWTDWLQSLSQSLADHHLYIWMILGLILAVAVTRFRYMRLAMAITGAWLLVWFITVVVAHAMLDDNFSTVQPPSWLWVHPLAPAAAAVLLAAVGWSASSRPLRRRWIIPLAILLIVAALLALFQAIDFGLAGLELHPVWLPRYLGFMCPAVIIVVASLLERLPFALLRWTILGLLVAVNITMAQAHVFAGNEPPLDKTAADALAGMDPASGVLAFTASAGPGGGPHGSGTIVDPSGAYYLYMLSQKPVDPQQFRDSSVTQFFPLQLQSDPFSIASAVSNQARVRRVIVWDGLDTGQTPPAEDILPRLGSPWRLESQDLYPVRCFWDWGQLYTYRWRVYVR